KQCRRSKSRWKKFARSVTGGEPQAKTKNLIARQSKRRDKEDERRGGAAHLSLAGSALAQPKQVRIVSRDRGEFTFLSLIPDLLTRLQCRTQPAVNDRMAIGKRAATGAC